MTVGLSLIRSAAPRLRGMRAPAGLHDDRQDRDEQQRIRIASMCSRRTDVAEEEPEHRDTAARHPAEDRVGEVALGPSWRRPP